ncbi:MAG: peptide-N-glycosidase [Bacteroidetes bacterium]|nr:MAG: peptide-N-glycosidase [Bacteroidota bacterium]
MLKQLIKLEIWLAFLGFVFPFFLTAAPADTLHVVTHSKETVVTDPAAGFKEYKRWGNFPAAKTPIRKIMLHVKFACPDTMRCADWDYLDYISIKRIGGQNGENKDFEIARMLTPYGGAFTKDWKFDWELDITDFSLLLRDSVEIEYYHSGYEPNHDRGWQVTLDFEIIKGRPSAEPISIQKIYGGNFKYGDNIASIETNLPPVSFSRKANADFAKLKISQTGHGANQPDGCGEFCSKKRQIIYNSNVIDTRSLWKKCGDNPLWPQAGTWIIDRANWCPGYLQIPDDYILPLLKENVIDVNMEVYTVSKTEAFENMAAYLIQYNKTIANYDASVEDIVVPTEKKIYQRENTACANAVIIIKNTGAETLKTMEITYNTNGFLPKKYQWKGNLAFNERDTITLPGNIDGMAAENYFAVSLTKPNNKPDEFPQDNKMASRFNKAPVHGGNLVMVIKTNNQPQHNSINVKNSNGIIVYSKQFDSTERDKLFRDTLNLKAGCYQLMLKDNGGDGLEFWFNNRGGRGYARLQDNKGNLIKPFESDFGSHIFYNFTVSNDSTIYTPINREIAIGLYPTRTTGSTTLDYFSGKEEDVLVQIVTDEGSNLIEEHRYKSIKEGAFTYDLSYRLPQRYYLKVYINGVLQFNKRIRVEKRR